MPNIALDENSVRLPGQNGKPRLGATIKKTIKQTTNANAAWPVLMLQMLVAFKIGRHVL